MNQKNYQFLTDTLERHGLGGPEVYKALETKMKLGKDEFEIAGLTQKYGNEKMVFAPKFMKGESRENQEVFYYLNRIKASFIKESGETLTAEFSLFNQRGFNTREMYNLLQGRPVYRKPRGEDGRWAKLDFNAPDDNGNLRVRNYYDNTTNFSLTREIGKLPIRWANPQEKEDDILALQSGERISATVRQDGRSEQVIIGVSPQLGGLTLYNKEMQVIRHTNSQGVEMMPETDLGQENKISQATGKNQAEVPDSTKELVKKINEQEAKQNQGQGQRQRRAS